MPVESSFEARPAAAGLPSILERILARRRARVAEAERRVPEAALRRRAEGRERREFLAGLRRGGIGVRPAVIAELKRASPSRGVLREDFDVPALAAGYERGGAAALSVLTEEDHFDGRLEYLAAARGATRLPILRKDFLFCNYQVWEAAANGADAVLLIAAMLDDRALGGLLAEAERAGLDTLVEVHDGAELERALAAGAECVGVNNRDLHTFTVATERAVELAKRMPAGRVAVAESGLRTGGDLARMTAAGYPAVLIGESFMQAAAPGDELARVLGEMARGWVKICGITRVEDARAAVEAGADAIGFVFAESPRRVGPERAAAIGAALPRGARRVGVFAGVALETVAAIAAEAGLDAVQLHGDYEAAAARGLARRVAVVRAVGMPAKTGALAGWRDFAAAFLLDSAGPGGGGGTGRTFAWERARALMAEAGRVPVLVAGGLRAENVGEAVAAMGDAAGVDTASGVESAPGIKDERKIKEFVRAARAAFSVPHA